MTDETRAEMADALRDDVLDSRRETANPGGEGFYPEWAPCPTCRGTGGGEYNDCPACGGNGVMS